jgi:hypothetical protein
MSDPLSQSDVSPAESLFHFFHITEIFSLKKGSKDRKELIVSFDIQRCRLLFSAVQRGWSLLSKTPTALKVNRILLVETSKHKDIKGYLLIMYFHKRKKPPRLFAFSTEDDRSLFRWYLHGLDLHHKTSLTIYHGLLTNTLRLTDGVLPLFFEVVESLDAEVLAHTEPDAPNLGTISVTRLHTIFSENKGAFSNRKCVTRISFFSSIVFILSCTRRVCLRTKNDESLRYTTMCTMQVYA